MASYMILYYIYIYYIYYIVRQYIVWPGIDADIESLCKHCTLCQKNKPNPISAQLHSWMYPERPWQRVHMDLAGPLDGKMYLIMVDANTKWPEVFCMQKDTTTTAVLMKVTEVISRWGIPEQIVTDNGRQFVAEQFEKFCAQNGIKHITSSVYHPRSNGEAERFVRTFKEAMKAKDINAELCILRFLFSYRATPHATTGCSPAELLTGRSLRTTLDLVRPDPKVNVMKSQLRQEGSYNKQVKMRSFQPGETVWVMSFSKNQEKWTRGKIAKSIGPVTYLVAINDKQMKRHVDQIRAAGASIKAVEPQEGSEQAEGDFLKETPHVSPRSRNHATPIQEAVPVTPQQDAEGMPSPIPVVSPVRPPTVQETPRARPKRNPKPISRLGIN